MNPKNTIEFPRPATRRRLFKAEFVNVKDGRKWLSSATYTDRAACQTSALEVGKDFTVSKFHRVVEFIEA